MQNQLKAGDYVAIVTDKGKFVRKIQWVSINTFEWTGGWGFIRDLVPNARNRKAKFILDQTNK